jgi:ABC-2 type transport system permease protein
MSPPAPRARRGAPDWLVIARREFLERVRTAWFIAVTLLGPIAMVGLIVVPAVLAATSGADDVRVQIVDHTDRLGEPIATGLQLQGWKAEVVPRDTTEAVLLGRIRDEAIDGFLTIPASVLDEDPARRGDVTYQGDNATSQMVVMRLAGTVNAAVLTSRFVGIVPDERLPAMIAPVGFEPRHTTGETSGTSGTAVFLIGYAVMIVLYMAIVLYAVNVLRSVVQEKTNRVVEIMVAAAKPRALMLGKILGVGAVGLVQVGVWAAMGVLSMTYRAELLGVFGVEAGAWSVPPIGLDVVAVVLAYFLLGYFFYAALYAAIGAMVSSEQEAQQAQTPVILLLIVPMMCMQLITNDPRGTAAEVLTLIPFSAPILMPMRYVLDGATATSVAISLVLLALSTWLAAWLAARIYRVGILMYGKRPSLRELGRWIRYG